MSAGSLVQKICSCLEILVEVKTTESSEPVRNLSKKEILFHQLKKNVHSAFQKLEIYDDLKTAVKEYIQPCQKNKCKTCDHLDFLALCLVLIKLLNEALIAEETGDVGVNKSKQKYSVPKVLLSISQLKVLKKCLQFVVALGILPNLLRGVGIPLIKKSEYGSLVEHLSSDCTPHQKHVQIVICVETLLNCLDCDAIHSIILTSYGCDLLSALFQLCHAPLKKIDDNEYEAKKVELKRDFVTMIGLIKDNSSYDDMQVIIERIHDRNHFTPRLEKLTKLFCRSSLMWELFLQLGFPVKDDRVSSVPKVPIWLNKLCNQMFTDLLLQKNGVATFVLAFLTEVHVRKFRFPSEQKFSPQRAEINVGQEKVREQLRQVKGELTEETGAIKDDVEMREVASEESKDEKMKEVANELPEKDQEMMDETSNEIKERERKDEEKDRNDASHPQASEVELEDSDNIARKDEEINEVACKASERDFDIQNATVDHAHVETVARIIATKPSYNLLLEDYVKRLSKQVFELLHSKGSQLDALYHSIASCLILQFCETRMKLAQKYFFDSIFKPLQLCVSSPGTDGVIVKENEFTVCIEDLYQIFVSCNSPVSRKHSRLLYPYFHCLCRLYFFLLEGISFLRSKVKGLLAHILSSASHEDAVPLLHAATFSSNKYFPVHLTKVRFMYGDEGGVAAVPPGIDDLSEAFSHCHGTLELLKELQNKSLNSSYFLFILQEFCNLISKMKEGAKDENFGKERLLCVILLKQFSEWNEEINEAILSNTSGAIDLVVALLDDACDETSFPKESIVIALIILNAVIENINQLTSAHWALLKRCLPNLQKLQKSNIDICLKQMVSSILTFIATHGAACENDACADVMKEFIANMSELSNQRAKNLKGSQARKGINKKSNKTCSSRKHTSDSSNISEGAGCSRRSSDNVKPEPQKKSVKDVDNIVSGISNMDLGSSVSKKESTFQAAMNDLKHSLVAVRGHALISLGKLLQQRDAETLHNKEELLKMFQENLEDEDSYIYLPAIQGLSLLADCDVELVLPTLLKEFQNPGKKACEVILKIGEVLLKICRLLGEFVYKYKEQMLHTYLIGAKHEDPRIRSSSLSNLGEACIYLKFNIEGHWLQEILVCVLALLKTDKDLEVRRCAVMVITLLFRGIGNDLLKVLEKEIKSLYIQLKIVYSTEADDVLRLHSQLALEEINVVMKELLLTKLPLKKEIRILQ
ncbi:transport and Golgi organization protein 6 homolog isoform X1 [Stegodyphus dumicola]|nr:transport and Golgi organization protein 6 homolog isoform X1 [Stegodyphus dumicola]